MMKRKTPALILISILVCVTGIAAAAFAEEDDPRIRDLHLVAKDNCGVQDEQPHLISGGNYRYPESDVPLNVVGADDPARTVAFGHTVYFRFEGLQPEAEYIIRLTYLSDGDRVQSLKANDRFLQEKVTLTRGEVVRDIIVLPTDIYADGALDLVFSRISGPNAVISMIEIWSLDATPLRRLEIEFEAVAPRLSPRPSDVAGVHTADGVAPWLSLDGTWLFHPDPPDTFHAVAEPAGEGWSDIEVPGQWSSQGFVVEQQFAASYFRSFRLPAGWKGCRVKLRCDAVYSDATIWINGLEAGWHMGGFTPFELDVTAHVRPGMQNTIALAVTNESLADVLASGTQYAAHQLGGITRKIGLFPLPAVNIAGLHATSTFDEEWRDATLRIYLDVANESDAEADGVSAVFELTGPDGKRVPLEVDSAPVPAVAAGKTNRQVVEITVPAPLKWDCEHPHLYTLACRLERDRLPLQTAERRIGFRQVEVRGNRLFVNNRPVKLRGVNRHETHPLLGRSLTPELWRRDAKLFIAANCNYIRTSHYPPAEEFVDACDELGLFVEMEAPLCWVGHGANATWAASNCHDPQLLEILAAANLEMIQRDLSHPSIIFWSLANESAWGSNFAAVRKCVDAADPSRPSSFHDQCWGDYNNHGSGMPIANIHYPGPGGPASAAEAVRPVLFGEYCHLNTYNRPELVADPGVRDQWGAGFAAMWEKMLVTPAVLGGAIWSGIDDVFHLPSGVSVGYGSWGPVDGWRREKPEYWHVKKTYSPVRVLSRPAPVPAAGEPIEVEIANRHDFTDMREVRIEWALEGEEGVAGVGIPPGETGTLRIKTGVADLAGKTIELRFISPRGFLIDEERLVLGGGADAAPRSSHPVSGDAVVTRSWEGMEIKVGGLAWDVDLTTGRIRTASVEGETVLTGGPELMILPLKGGPCRPDHRADIEPFNDVCTEWKVESFDIESRREAVEIHVAGNYKEAAGTYTLRFDLTGPERGMMTVRYRFECTEKISPRQIGMVFDAPIAYDRFSWKRDALWTAYPGDHIGRPAGTAMAFYDEAVPDRDLRLPPAWPWSHDSNAQGSNDFRATRTNIHWVALHDGSGRGPKVLSDGTQAARAWIDGDRVRFLVAGFSTGGADLFFGSHLAHERRPLEPGSVVEDTIVLSLEQFHR